MLTDKQKNEIRESMKKYKTPMSAVMDALRVAQSNDGHISKNDMLEIAELLGIKPVEVNAAAAFYTMYNVEKPVGKYHVQVCRNISCSLLGAEHIIRHIERCIGIKKGETTPDRKFTLSLVECLGSCGTAPMMQINEDYYENLTEQKVTEILANLK